MGDSCLLFLHDGLEDAGFIILRLHLLCFQVNYLTKKVHSIAPRQNFPKDLTRELLQRVLEALNRQVGGEVGLQRVGLVVK